METLPTLWPPDPHDLSESRNMLTPGSDSPPAGGTWTQQLSPHLQRNKQLQDALLQREEQLASLQEENNKLRGFLCSSSSSLRSLQLKAQKLTADGRRDLKRTGPPYVSKQISKRVCRNLMTQFCSEPDLDLWVLRTLGLKDPDTIDTRGESSAKDRFRASGFGESSSKWTPSSCFRSPVLPGTPSPVCSYSRRPELDPGLRLSYDGPDSPIQTCTRTPEDFTAARLSGPNEALIQSQNRSFLTDTPESRSIKVLCPVQTQDRNQEEPSPCWSSLLQNWTPSGFISPVGSSSPVPNKPWIGSGVSGPVSPPGPPDPLQKPHRQTDLAFSMSLSPSSSVKTLSFPQGQAFIRRDTGGPWNFTWVPRQEPRTP